MPKPSTAPAPTALGALISRRREELGLSLREAARQAGISPGYLVALERGLNPSTGRASTPSLPIMVSLGRVLDVELEALLDAVVAPAPSSTHVLLYQVGARWRSPLEAARSLFAGRVKAWIEIVDPRRPDETRPSDDVLIRGERSLVSPPVFEQGAALTALAELLGAAPRPARPGQLGVVFGGNSSVLRSIDNPSALLESERTWEHDVAAQFQDVLGVTPVANVCVYRESDLQELSGRLDPLATALALIRAHPHVAAQDAGGDLSIGSAAIETILTAARPQGTSFETWRSLTRAAAAGLARESVLAHVHPPAG
jgi:transcriptional regulator with XRE-family HTH domain